jgi:hypothetical protein
MEMVRMEMARMRHTLATAIRRLTLVALLVAGLLITAGAGAARALPTGCSGGMISALTGSAYCQGGTGEFRVRLICHRVWPLGDRHVVGAWRPAGGVATSQATCPLFQTRSVTLTWDLKAPL